MGCAQSKQEEAVVSTIRRRSSFANDKDVSEGRIEACTEVESTQVGEATVRFAYLSQRGYYPDELNKPNQDSYSITRGIGVNDTDTFFAVYDGHGKEGDLCAKYARKELPNQIERIFERERMRESTKLNMDKSVNGQIDLMKDQIQNCIHRAHITCNTNLRNNESIDDKLSGTTAISVFFHGPGSRITVSNVGDSRAILGQYRKNNYRALPLSRDQTPYRRDERKRVIAAGARVLSLDQIEGLEPINDNWDDDIELGEEIDEWGDPPRVWAQDGEYPGTAFTRSIGDAVAESLGVYAEPEMITKELGMDDKILVLASDGVFEFLTNQSVIDICAKFQSPLEACRAVVAEAYELWLQYELRTDDITIICIFIDNIMPPDPEHALNEKVKRRRSSKKNSVRANPAVHDVLAEDDELVEEGSKPVRTGASKAVTRQLQNAKVELEEVDVKELIVEKTAEEKQRISEVIKGNHTFQNISTQQKDLLYDVMERKIVTTGEWVIKQGDIGDYFYIVDYGKFEVRVLADKSPPAQVHSPEDGGDVVHVYEGTPVSHPTFGEIALLHSIPRAASIIAQTNGQLWALHRAVFNKIIMERSDRKNLQKALKNKVDALKGCEPSEIEVLSNHAEEVLFKPGQVVVKKGDPGDYFYFVIHGKCVRKEDGVEVKENEFFGEKFLLKRGSYAFTIEPLSTTKCFKLSIDFIKNFVQNLDEKRLKYEAKMSSRRININGDTAL